MSRRSALASLVATGALVLAPGAVSAAPAPPSPHDPPAAVGGTSRGDVDGDHVSDDFVQRLRTADAAEHVAVIVTGLTADRALGAVGRFEVTHRLPLIDGFSAVMTAGQARALTRAPGVRRVEADGVVVALDDATNSDFGATAARVDREGLDGSGVGICITDTGIDPNHEQLSGRVVAFDDEINHRSTPYDDHGHGTHVASIAAGDGTGSAAASSFMGVAPAAVLYAAKVLDSSGSGSDSQVIAGVQWCHAQAGVRVISMSLGDTTPSDGTDALSVAVDNAVAGGEVVTVAAGNSGDAPQTINAPGVAAGALTVGAVSDWSAPVGTARHDDGIWLAGFSSRGPVRRSNGSLDIKPDVASPGVSVTAARSGTVSGYTTMSGTSMSTPYVAGAVALALQANSAATPGVVKSTVAATALDRGVSGADNEWGAGLVDVRAFVDAMAGATTPQHNSFPSMSHSTGSVGPYGSTTFDIEVPTDGLGVPLAVMLTLSSGRLNCDLYCQVGLTPGEWSPDIDMELRAPDGTLLTDSQCTLSGVTCGTGRQETVAIRPQVAGTYRLRVYEWSGSSGTGGSFGLDVSRGPLSGTVATPPPAANQPPTADAGPDQAVKANRKTKTATFTLNGSGIDPEGATLTYRWTRQNGSVVTAAASMTDTQPVGSYVYTLTVTDPAGLHDSDTATVTVRR